MSAITLDTTEQQYIISIDRNLMDKPAFRLFFERLRTEALADQINSDETDLMALSEEIKADWWAANGTKILDRIEKYTPPSQ